MGKVTELDAALQQLNPEDAEEEDEEDEEECGDDSCGCFYCKSSCIGGLSHHVRSAKTKSPRVEAVYVHVSALEDMKATAPYIAPRLKNHVCTVIFLHCLNCHDPWRGWEHMFALPEGKGPVRVVFVLAKDASWHEYPDSGSFSAGVPWMNILDMDSMDRTDKLIERLVDHETHLLGGRSDRIVLTGMSQGGGQSMLRFMRSQKKLGGWLGAMCHVPTTPHTPRERDPLVDQWRSSVNRDRPVRLLTGGADVVFPPALVLRDAARMREVGGFSDVQVEVQPTLKHDGWGPVGPAVKDQQCVDPSVNRSTNLQVPDLVFVRKHLLSIIDPASTA
jgi:predicted esterase